MLKSVACGVLTTRFPPSCRSILFDATLTLFSPSRLLYENLPSTLYKKLTNQESDESGTNELMLSLLEIKSHRFVRKHFIYFYTRLLIIWNLNLHVHQRAARGKGTVCKDNIHQQDYFIFLPMLNAAALLVEFFFPNRSTLYSSHV